MESLEFVAGKSVVRATDGFEDFTRKAALAFAECLLQPGEHAVAIFIAIAGYNMFVVKAIECDLGGRFFEIRVLNLGNKKLKQNRPVGTEESKDVTATFCIKRDIVIARELFQQVKSLAFLKRRNFPRVEIVD